MQRIAIYYKETPDQPLTYYISRKETATQLKAKVSAHLDILVDSLSLSYTLADSVSVISVGL